VIPVFGRGHALEPYLAASRVPVADISVEVPLEGFEAVPFLVAEELVLQMPEEALGASVVEAVSLARHALDEPRARYGRAVPVALVLPAHVAGEYGAGALRLPSEEHAQHLSLLGHVGVLGYRPGHDLVGAEVEHGRQVRLAEAQVELGDVGAHLLPWPTGPEVASQQVLEGAAHLAPVGVVPVVFGLAAYAASQPHLAHHLEHGLAGDAHAVLGPQAHHDLPVPAAVGRAPEYLLDLGPQLPARGPGLPPEVVVVGGARDARRLQQVVQPVPLPRKPADHLAPVPRARPSASRARSFFKYATSALSFRFSASSSCSRVGSGPGRLLAPLGLPFGLGLSASGPPSLYAFTHLWSADLLAMPCFDITAWRGIPSSRWSRTAASFVS
jgi:hypothetical protein